MDAAKRIQKYTEIPNFNACASHAIIRDAYIIFWWADLVIIMSQLDTPYTSDLGIFTEIYLEIQGNIIDENLMTWFTLVAKKIRYCFDLITTYVLQLRTWNPLQALLTNKNIAYGVHCEKRLQLRIQLTAFTNPTVHLSQVPQCTIS